MVHQKIFKPFSPHAPINVQVLGKKTGDILTASVRHKAGKWKYELHYTSVCVNLPGSLKLSHVGINPRYARLSFRPVLEQALVMFPLLLVIPVGLPK